MDFHYLHAYRYVGKYEMRNTWHTRSAVPIFLEENSNTSTFRMKGYIPALRKTYLYDQYLSALASHLFKYKVHPKIKDATK